MKKGRHEKKQETEIQVKESSKNTDGFFKTVSILLGVIIVLMLAALLFFVLFWERSDSETASPPEAFTNNIDNVVNVYPENGVQADTDKPKQGITETTTTEPATTITEAPPTTIKDTTTTTAEQEVPETTSVPSDSAPPASAYPTTTVVPEAKTSVVPIPGYEPNIGVQQFISPDLADPGDIIEYSLTLTNFGQGKALNVVVSEILPQGLTYADTGTRFREWNFGDIEANGGKKNVAYHVEVGSNTSFGAYDNVLTIKADNHNEFNITNSLNVVSNP